MSTFWSPFVDAGAVATIAMLGVVARQLWRLTRNVGHMLEDWRGEPARPGVPARAGVMIRLEAIERNQVDLNVTIQEIHHEVFPNSGASMRDSVAAIHQATTGRPDPGVNT